jgi:hypothetical protein
MTDADNKRGSRNEKQKRVYLSRRPTLFCNNGGEVPQVTPSLLVDLLQRLVVISALDAEVFANTVPDLLLRPVRMHRPHDGDHLRDLIPLQCSVNCGGSVRRMMTGLVQIADAEHLDFGEPIQPLKLTLSIDIFAHLVAVWLHGAFWTSVQPLETQGNFCAIKCNLSGSDRRVAQQYFSFIFMMVGEVGLEPTKA